MNKSIILLLLFFSYIFAVGGGNTPTFTPNYNFNLDVSYSCKSGEILVTVSNLTEIFSVLDNFDISIAKEGLTILSGKTSGNGKVKFFINEDGRYLVRGQKANYFEQLKAIDVASCAVKEAEFLCEAGNMKDRVKCVLNLPDDYIDKVRYVPEECRALLNNPEKQKCIENYRLLQTCRTGRTTDVEREACAKPKLNLSDNIQYNIDQCKTELGSKKRLCFQRIKDSVFLLTKFRIYNLAYKAYELKEKGASEADVVDFITLLNEKKIAFNNAQTADKKKIVEGVKAEWAKFKEKVKKQIEAK